jgi:hypothetical protein
MAMKRKRGCNVVITDCTNTAVAGSRDKRSCTAMAEGNIHKLFQLQRSPRSSSSCPSQQPSSTIGEGGVNAECVKCTLNKTFKARPEILQKRQEIIHAYMERHSPFHLQKAMALNIFSISVSEGKKITNVCISCCKVHRFQF